MENLKNMKDVPDAERIYSLRKILMALKDLKSYKEKTDADSRIRPIVKHLNATGRDTVYKL